MLRVYFGHHKCASQYIKAILLRVTDLLGMIPHQVDNFSAALPLDYHTREPFITLLEEHRQRLRSERLAALFLTNGDREAVGLLDGRNEPYRGFHVIRDPRDIMVSAYFSHLYSHPIRSEGGWIAEFRRQLEAAGDIERGLLLELEFNAPILAAMAEWDYAHPQIYETRYEILITDPVAEFCRILNFMGIATPRWGAPSRLGLIIDQVRRRRTGRPMPLRTTLPLPVLQCIIAAHAFERKAGGRQPGEEDARHHYRKGVPGDWRTYFTPQVTTAFKKRYGDLLITLGYEKGKDW